MKTALNAGKPILPAFQEKITQSQTRLQQLLVKAQLAAGAGKQKWISISNKVHPSIFRAQSLAVRLRVKNKSDFDRLVLTARKPNQYRGRPYPNVIQDTEN